VLLIHLHTIFFNFSKSLEMFNCVRCGKENDRQICEACREKRRFLTLRGWGVTETGPVKVTDASIADKAAQIEAVLSKALLPSQPVIVKRKPGRPRKGA
jgi:hypothetical protein